MITTILYSLIIDVLWLLFWAVILQAVVSTLIAFNVLDTRNRLIWSIADFLTRVTEPLLRPIRRRMPNTGGIDFSPWVLVVLIRVVAIPVVDYLYAGIHFHVWQPLL